MTQKGFAKDAIRIEEIIGTVNQNDTNVDKIVDSMTGLTKAQQEFVLSNSELNDSYKTTIQQRLGIVPANTAAASSQGVVNTQTAIQTAYIKENTKEWLKNLAGKAKALALNPTTWIIGATIAISAFTKAIKDNQKAFAEDFKQVASSVKGTKQSLEGYKSQYEDLVKTVNDPLATPEQIADARQGILDLQKTMAAEFPDVKFDLGITADVNSITQAGQVIDNVLNQQIDKILNDFDEKYKTGPINRLINWFGQYSGGIDRAKGSIENYEYMTSDGIHKTGNAYDVYEIRKSQLVEGQKAGIDVSAIEAEIEKIEKIFEEYGEAYLLLTENNIPKNALYKKTSDDLNELTEAYNQAFLTGDQDKIDQAITAFYDRYLEAFNEFDASGNADSGGMKQVFEKRYADMLSLSLPMQFKDRYKADKDFQYLIKQTIDELELSGNTFEMLADASTVNESQGIESWTKLSEAAKEYGMTVQDVVKFMQEAGEGGEDILTERQIADNSFIQRIADNTNKRNGTSAPIEDYLSSFLDLQATLAEDKISVTIDQIKEAWVGVVEVTDDWSRGLKKTEKELRKTESKSGKLAKSFKNLVASEDFKEPLDQLKKTALQTQLTGKDIEELASQNEELARCLEESGISATFAAACFQSMIEGGKGFDLITDATIQLDESLHGLSDELKQTADAYSKYEAIMNDNDYDKQFEDVRQIYVDAETNFQNGEYGKKFWAQMQYLFGEAAFDMSIEELRKKFVGLNKVFGENATNGYEFLEMLYKNKDELKGMSDQFEITYDKVNGYHFNLDMSDESQDIKKLAEYFGLSEEAIISCIEALNMFGKYGDYDLPKVEKAILDMSTSMGDGFKAVTESQLEEYLMMCLGDVKAVHDIMEQIKADSNKGFSIIDLSAEKEYENLAGIIADINASGNSYSLKMDISSVEEAEQSIADLDFLLATIKKEDGSFNISTEGLDEIGAKYEELLHKKREIQEPGYLTVDTSELDPAMADAQKKIETYMDLIDKAKANLKIGKDVDSDLAGQIRDAASALDKLDPEIKASLDLDRVEQQIRDMSVSNDAEIKASISPDSLSSIEVAINSVLEEQFQEVKVGADASDISKKVTEGISSIQKWLNGNAVNVRANANDIYNQGIKARNDLQTQFNNNPVKLSIQTPQVSASTVSSSRSGGNNKTSVFAKASGTMLAPAYATGNVALEQNEEALVNELG